MNLFLKTCVHMRMLDVTILTFRTYLFHSKGVQIYKYYKKKNNNNTIIIQNRNVKLP